MPDNDLEMFELVFQSTAALKTGSHPKAERHGLLPAWVVVLQKFLYCPAAVEPGGMVNASPSARGKNGSSRIRRECQILILLVEERTIEEP